MNAADAALTGPPPERRLAWLLGPMRRHKATYTKVAVAAALINLFGLATALFSMLVYDRVVPNNAQSSLVALSIGLIIIVVFDVALRMLRAYFVDLAGAGIDDDVGARFFDRLLLLRLELGRASTGALAGLARELETLRDFFASATLTAIVDVPFIFVTLLVVALIGGPVVWVPLIMIPVVLAIGWLSQPALERWGARALGDGLLKQSVLVETVGGLETVKATGAGTLLAERWRKAMAGQNDSSLRQRLLATVGITAATTAATLSYAGVVVVGVNQIAKGELTIGGLIACSVLAGRAIAPLTQISQLLTRLSATRAALNQLDALMRRPPEGPAGEPLRPGRVAGAVEFRGVTFTYPGAPEPALRDVSFKVQAGERVALLGRVGSGKSTVLRLMMALYPPSEGLILLDGIDLRQFDPAALRARIGAALQDSVLLSGSVRDNVTLGRAEVDDEEMIRASSLSGTHDFMGALANGYELKLADRGEGLSGGQRQSIAIARALAGRPPVLLFDEPTSAMDAGTEQALLERLSTELRGRTLLLVTHRPPLLALVSRVVLLDRGRVIADGPRDEVLARLGGRSKVAA